MNDYISRDMAIARLTKLEVTDELATMTDAKREIAEMPSVNVAPVKHGQWEWFDEDTGTPITGYEREWGWRCSRCKHELPDDYDDPDYRPMLDYCPYCGAKMDGDSDG